MKDKRLSSPAAEISPMRNSSSQFESGVNRIFTIKKSLPVVSSSVLPNTDLRDKIIKRIQDEEKSSTSSVKHVQASR